MQITVRETRAQLRVTNIWISPENREGDTITVTGSVYNGGYAVTDKPFLVSFYVDYKCQNYVRITDPTLLII